MNPGIIGGIVGSVLGVIGGLIGTYYSIKNTNGPRERAFVICAAIVCWVSVEMLLSVIVFLPQARLWVWIPYCILLPLGIRYGNRKQMAIRREEQTNALERTRRVQWTAGFCVCFMLHALGPPPLTRSVGLYLREFVVSNRASRSN